MRVIEESGLIILAPDVGEVVRPLVHAEHPKNYFSRFPALRGAVNGTFFQGTGLSGWGLFGDLKTDYSLKGDTPQRAFHKQGAFFWQPASAVNKAGYEKRWAVMEKADGSFALRQGQPCSFADTSEAKWLIGGGAALVSGGRPIQSSSELKSVAGGNFTDQTRVARRSVLAIRNAELHIVMASALKPEDLAGRLVDLGYTDAVMFDGGGAATLLTRANGSVQTLVRHNSTNYPTLPTMLGILTAQDDESTDHTGNEGNLTMATATLVSSNIETVGDVVRRNRDQDTSRVKGLSDQVISEVNQMLPQSVLIDFSDLNIAAGSHVNTLLHPEAKGALKRAIEARGSKMSVRSAYRSCIQQHYLLEQKRVNGIGTLVATPGMSPHESGLALDIDDHQGWMNFLTQNNWQWQGPADPVHFTYMGGGANTDIDTLCVKAFQELWNRKHPEDKLEPDGRYGTETAKRMNASPASGFGNRVLREQTPPLEGPDVVLVQKMLTRGEFLKGEHQTGKYDQNTIKAVKKFQQDRGLVPVDGVVGLLTLKRLGNLAPELHSTPVVRQHPMLRLDDSGEAVKHLQTLLDIKADGIFGSRTLAAVKAFQSSRNLDVDGIVGPDTWAALSDLTGNVRVVAVSVSTRTVSDLNAELSDSSSVIAVAIGHSEGNRDANGGHRQSFNGHIDPGNGRQNKGTFSVQKSVFEAANPGLDFTPANADRFWLGRLRAQMTRYVQQARSAGLDPNNAFLAASFFDLYTQAPLAAVGERGLLDRFGTFATIGLTRDHMVDARVGSYFDPRTGRLDAPGFGNSLARLTRDQERRTDALLRVLGTFGIG